MAAAALVAAFGLACTGSADARDSKDCKRVKIAELPLKFERNRPLVHITVNGKPAWFMIDTGAAFSSMFGGAAKAFALGEDSVDGLRLYGVGSGLDAKQVVVSEFGLGAAKVKNVRLLSLGHDGSADSAGLLGRTFLGRLGDIAFDLAAGVLRFWNADNCQNRSLAYWTKAPTIADLNHYDDDAPYIVKMRINGKPVDAELDSGHARRAGHVARRGLLAFAPRADRREPTSAVFHLQWRTDLPGRGRRG